MPGRVALIYLAMALQTATLPNLDALRWHNRLLIIFASTANDAEMTAQQQLVDTHAHAFEERDLKVFTVIGSALEVKALRQKLHISNGSFAVVLIGKDGLVKLRKTSVLPVDELFRTIDSMPMRRQEMRERK